MAISVLYGRARIGESFVPTDDGRRFNWYHRYWHDWPEVEQTVFEVARAHARYLGYKVYRIAGEEMPPGDPAKVGPVMRIKLFVVRDQKRHGQPAYELIYVDVERHAGKFSAKTAARDEG